MRKETSACTLMRNSRVQINIILIVLSSSKEAQHIYVGDFFFDNLKISLQLNDAIKGKTMKE